MVKLNLDLILEWNWERNNEINPKTMELKSRKTYWWICTNGHEWLARLDHRKSGSGNCKICRKLKVLAPELIVEWDWNKNAGLNPHELYVNAKKKLDWKCIKGHEWSARLDHRKSGSKCPVCAGQKTIRETSLAGQYPNLLKEWDYKKNKISPYEVPKATIKSYWWMCKKGHNWEASVANRTRRGDACPYCSGKKATAQYNLDLEYPHIALQWDYDKNLTVKPGDVLPYSNEKYWWRCKEGHSWKDKVCTVVSGNRCSICYPRKKYQAVSNEYNLKLVSPALVKQLHPNKNGDLDPEKIAPFSGRKLYWICSEGHEWSATIDNRQKGRNCPKCNVGYGTSFIEQAIYYYLKRVFEEAISRHKISYESRDNKKIEIEIEVDIYIPSLKLAIEYDGYFFHRESKEKDELKNKILNELNVRLLRIRENNGANKLLPQIRKYGSIEIPHNGMDLRGFNGLMDKIVKFLKERLNVEDILIDADISRDALEIKEEIRKELKKRSLAFISPELEKQWDYPRNGALSPENVFPSDQTSVYWKCSVCDKGWEQGINVRYRNTACPYCTGSRAGVVNSFEINYSDKSKYWHPTRNESISPNDIFAVTKDEYWFKCLTCTREWIEPVRNIVRRKYNCKICRI